MEPLVSLKNECEEFEVEFEILPSIDLGSQPDSRRAEIQAKLSSLEDHLEANQKKIDDLNVEIGRLTNHADGWDYTAAVVSGLLTGMIDVFLVGEWNFENAKAISNKAVNEKVIAFAKKDPEYGAFIKRKKDGNRDPNRLKSAIEFLEQKYKLPGDGGYNISMDETNPVKVAVREKLSEVTHKTHHLDDFCHHPTLIGLISSIIVQFTDTATYHPAHGTKVKVPLSVNESGNFVGENASTKVFAGMINWFFSVAKNQKGHLMSDMVGTKNSAGGGSGIPGPFLSTLKELSALPCFQDTNFGENLRRAFQNGIGNGKAQLDLGIFNGLFEGASSKLDMRTEMAVTHELKRQAVPVILNEIFVRGFYFIRRFIAQMKETDSVMDLDWIELIPARNRTIVRMLTIATGTFTAVDMADAAIRAAGKSGGNLVAFAANMVLRVNFVGVGRFAVAVGADVTMGIQRSWVRNERIKLYQYQIDLTGAKVFYKQGDMWISAEDAGNTIEEAYEIAAKAIAFYIDSIREIEQDLERIGTHMPEVEEKNPELIGDIKDILKWG